MLCIDQLEKKVQQPDNFENWEDEERIHFDDDNCVEEFVDTEEEAEK